MEPDVSPYEDPRIKRTRTHVILSARALMKQGGAEAVTFSALSTRTGLSRQTLYNNWPTRERLLAALILDDSEATFPQPSPELGPSITSWLMALRDSLAQPSPTGDALAAIMVHARSDEGSREAIRHVIDDRHAAFDAYLAGQHKPLDDDEWARLVGPIFYRLFFSFQPVDDDFLAALAGTVSPKPVRRTARPKRAPAQ